MISDPERLVQASFNVVKILEKLADLISAHMRIRTLSDLLIVGYDTLTIVNADLSYLPSICRESTLLKL